MVMITFSFCLALMILFALAFVIMPLLKASTSSPVRSRSIFALLLSITVFLPTTAIGLYYLLGEPRALDPTQLIAKPIESTPTLQEAINQLVDKLQQEPNNPEGWALLGRAYKTTKNFAQAREAFKKAFALLPENADLMIDYAEALSLASNSHRIEGEARELLEQATVLDPQNQRGLWLLGISDYQAENYKAAIEHWNNLLPLLAENSDVAKSVREQIEKAKNNLGSNDKNLAKDVNSSQSNQNLNSSTTSVKLSVIKLNVKVTLAEHLKHLIDPKDTVFVFAKAVDGPPMPLVVQKFPATQLPLAITLDDSMSMLPNTKLSQSPKITIGARISKSGNATAQSGDLEGITGTIETQKITATEIVIDKVKK